MAMGKLFCFKRLLSLPYTRQYAMSSRKEKQMCRPNAVVLGQRVKLMAEILGLSVAEGNDLVSKNSLIQNIDPARLKRTISFLNGIKIPTKSVLEHPDILCRLPFSIEQQYCSLIELGLHPVGMPEILRFDYLMSVTSEKLMRLKLLGPCVNPVDRLLRAAGDTIDGAAIVARHPDLVSKPLQRIRRVFFRELLSAKLGCSCADAELLLRKHPLLVQRSLGLIRETIDVLTGEFTFPVSAIRSHEFLLLTDPDSLRQIRVTLLGAFAAPPVATNLAAFLRSHPRILLAGADNVSATTACLHEYGISGDQIARCGQIFSLRPATVRQRLARIFSSPSATDLESGSSFRNVLPLVYNFRRAWPQLLVGECDSSAPADVALWQIQRRRRLLWGRESSLRNVIVARVAERLACSQDEVGAALRVRLAEVADWQTTDPLTAVDVLDLLLLERGFSVQQVINALPIVLHDRRAVAAALDDLLVSEHLALFDYGFANPYILQLVLYIMKSDVVAAIANKGTEAAKAGGEGKVESRTQVGKVETKTKDDKGGSKKIKEIVK